MRASCTTLEDFCPLERDFHTARNVHLRETPTGPDEARTPSNPLHIDRTSPSLPKTPIAKATQHDRTTASMATGEVQA